MSAPQRSGRGRGRGRGRGGSSVNGGSPSANANEDESGVRGASRRGRGTATFTNGVTRGINKTLQQRPNSQQIPRGPKIAAPNARGRVGVANGSVTSSRERISSGPSSGSVDERYNKLKKLRENERASAIRNGFLADPDKPRSLKDAITMVGTCQDMCPEFERLTRIVQKDEWGPEMITTVGENGEAKRLADEARMIKKFRRSAAGVDEQLPSDLRPPSVLLRTVNYLFNDLINEADSLLAVQNFIWDRTRAIRNDFTIQQVTKTPDLRLAIECYEHIARYHILSLHQIGGLDKEKTGDKYNHQQDREQFDKTLLSLLRYYDDVRDRYRSPNEAEFRAYWIVFQVQNNTSDLEDRVQSWPANLIHDPQVQRALTIYAAACEVIDGKGPFDRNLRAKIPIAQQNWGRFWRLVGSKQVSYLLSCVAEIHFNTIRRIVLHTILGAIGKGGSSKTDWTLEELEHVLGFDEEEQTESFLGHYGFSIDKKDDGTLCVDFTMFRTLPNPTGLPPQTFSWGLVEKKRYGRTFPAIIQGMSVKEARASDMIVEDWESEQPIAEMKEESLFVTGDSDEETAVKTSAKPQLNPTASLFQPTTQASSTPFSGLGGFGQTSAKPSFGLGGFGQPSFAKSTPSQPTATPVQNPFAITTVKPSFSFVSTSTSASTPTSSPTITAPPQQSISTTFSFAPSNNTKPSSIFQSPNPKPFASSNDTSTPRASIFDSVKSTSQLSEAVNGSKPFNFTNPSGGFGFSSSQGGANKENIPSPIPEVQVTPPKEENSSSLTAKSPFNFTKDAMAANPFPSPQNTLESTKPLISAPFVNIQQTPSNTVSSRDSGKIGQPQFPLPSPSEPAQPSNPTMAPVLNTPGLPGTSPFPKFEFPPVSKPSELVGKAQGSATSSLPPTGAVQPTTTPISSNRQLVQPVQTILQPRAEDSKTRESEAWDYVSTQLLLHPTKGILKQFLEHIAGPIVIHAMKEYQEEKLWEEAEEFRWWVLAYRYGAFWRRNVAAMRARRLGRERRLRLAAEKEAHTLRAKEKEIRKKEEDVRRNAAKETVDQELDKFRANLEARRLMSHPTLDLGYDLIGQPQNKQQPSLTSSQMSQEAVLNGKSRGNRPGRMSVRAHKRSHTQPNVSTILASNNSDYRVTKPSREPSPTPSIISNRSSILGASILSGAPLLDSLGLPPGTKMSTMKSSYFTLKALGLQPSASIAPPYTHRAGKKRARGSDEFLADNDSITDYSTSGHKKRFTPLDQISFSSPIQNEASELRINAVLSSPLNASTSSQSKAVLPEDEALFARIRTVIQAMDESTAFFKEEIAKEDMRESQSGSPHGLSPLNVHLKDSPPNPNLPKYYSRSSRFLPREEYGKRREMTEDLFQDVGKGKTKVDGPATPQSNGLTNGIRGYSSTMPPPRQRLSRPLSKPSQENGSQQQKGASVDDAIEL